MPRKGRGVPAIVEAAAYARMEHGRRTAGMRPLGDGNFMADESRLHPDDSEIGLLGDGDDPLPLDAIFR